MRQDEIQKLGTKPFKIFLRPAEPRKLSELDYTTIFGYDTEFVDHIEMTEEEEIEYKELKTKIRESKISKKDRLYAYLYLQQQGKYDFNTAQFSSLLGKMKGIDISYFSEGDFKERFEEIFGSINETAVEEYIGLLDRFYYLYRKRLGAVRKVLTFQLACTADDGIKSRVDFVNDEYIDIEQIYNAVKEMRMKYYGIDKMPNKIYLIAHFAQAELSCIKQFSPKYIYKEKANVLEISNTYIGDVKYKRTKFVILDTFAFFKTSLEALGDMLDYKKIKIPQHYKENMEVLLKENFELYEKYASRDAEVALKLFLQVAEIGLQEGVNILKTPSAPSFFMDIFRRNYLDGPAVPVIRNGYKTKIALNPKIRLLAMLAYHGGRNEAFKLGRIFKKVYYYDIKSCYPVSAQIQPLPVASTEWYAVDDLDDVEEMEGFARVTFKFPLMEKYPCLPVETPEYLLYPNSGESFATFAEIRLAREMGAKINIEEGWGFYPGKAENSHALKRYMKRYFEARATATEKFNKDYYKLGMNSLIGKFAQRVNKINIVKMSKDYEVPISQIDTIVDVVNKDKYKMISLGSGFSPEWAALILGKARALLSDIIRSNDTIMAITDSAIMHNEKPNHCKAIDEIESVGSYLEKKGEGTSALIFRDRAYYIFNGKKIAFDSGGSEIKGVGGLGARKTDTDFDNKIRDFMFYNGELPREVKRNRLTRFREAYKEDYKWNVRTAEIVSPAYDYYKRKPVDYNKYLTKMEVDTVPFMDIDEFYEFYNAGKALEKAKIESYINAEVDYGYGKVR